MEEIDLKTTTNSLVWLGRLELGGCRGFVSLAFLNFWNGKMFQSGIALRMKLAVCVGLMLSLGTSLYCVELRGEDGVTVKGRIAQSDKSKLKIEFSNFPLSLTEDLNDKLPTPKLPAGWDEMDLEQRQIYAAQFESSEAGKRMLAERKRILSEVRQFDVVLEESGEFVVYDVAPGTYELRGRKDVKIDDYTYAFEIFGQIVVSLEADEILLDPVMVLVTPLFERGQPMPDLQIDIFDDQTIVDKSSLSGKPIFLSFWSANFSPPSVAFQPLVQEMFLDLKESYDLILVSISLDPTRELASKTIKEKKLMGYHGFSPGWQSETVETFGVRALPYFMLIGPDHKILMTHLEIREAFSNGTSLAALVERRLSGEDLEKTEKQRGKLKSDGK